MIRRARNVVDRTDRSSLILSRDGKTDSNRICKVRQLRRRRCSLPPRSRQSPDRGTTDREAACNKEPVSAGSCSILWPADGIRPKPENDGSVIRHVGSQNNRPEMPKRPPESGPAAWPGGAARRLRSTWRSGSPPRRPECCLFS